MTQSLALDDPPTGIGKCQLEDILGEIAGDANGRRCGSIVRGDGDSMQLGLLM